jgi:hypothetical protein
MQSRSRSIPTLENMRLGGIGLELCERGKVNHFCLSTADTNKVEVLHLHMGSRGLGGNRTSRFFVGLTNSSKLQTSNRLQKR